jgi:adenosine deaminase
VLRDFRDDGVRYLELRTTPRENIENGITKEVYVSAVLDCINDFGRDEMSTYLILSVDRRNTAEQAMETVDLAIRHKGRGIVGVDLCGNPAKGDVSIFRAAFAKAKANGLKVTLHFAEIPESSTIEELQTLLSYHPDRLGHVINVPARIKEKIRELGLGLELCLSCNVHAKLTQGGFADHHFAEWKDSTCPISLCVRTSSGRCVRGEMPIANRSRPMMSGYFSVRCLTNIYLPPSISSLTASSLYVWSKGLCRRYSQEMMRRRG